MRLQRNTERLLVVNGAANITTSRKGKYISDLAAGEIAVISLSGKVIDSTEVANHPKFKIGYKQTDGTLNISDVIDIKTVHGMKGVKAAAAKEQISYLGFNGTSGAIDLIEDNIYLLSLAFFDQSIDGSGEMYRRYGVHTTTNNPTQVEVVNGLVANLVDNFKYETDWRVKCERVSKEAGNAAGTAVDSITFTKGSKYFTATNIDDATTNAAMAIGDAIRVGTSDRKSVV